MAKLMYRPWEDEELRIQDRGAADVDVKPKGEDDTD